MCECYKCHESIMLEDGLEWPDGGEDKTKIFCHTCEIERLEDALRKSVKLQSHYAGLLNIYDGGERIKFNNIDEWLTRLGKMGAL